MPKNSKNGLISYRSLRKFGQNSFSALQNISINTKQRFRALRDVPLDDSRAIHLLFMKRDQYFQPTIKCLNSIWFNSPREKITVWVDVERKQLFEKSISKLHRSDRVELRIIPLPDREWQRNKLEIIVKLMERSDLFTDADMIWNSVPPRLEKPLFFVDEYDLGKRTNTRWLLKQLGLDRDFGWRMLNVSVVALGEKSKYPVFANRSIELYEKIRTLSQDSELGSDDLPGLHRMAEQIALSIAAQELGEYRVLKETDSYMDGGLAESYYLGAINGYD